MVKHRLYIICFFIISSYFTLLKITDIKNLSTIFGTTATIVGGLAIWVQLKRDGDLKEAEFLMEYNFNFINDKKLTNIQKTLENYSKGDCTKEDITTIDRQDLINFLVYLEALAAMVNKGVLKIETIDNLFSYRFFIATNNPVVQELELIPDAEYYRGCYVLHKKWVNYKKKKGQNILQEEFSLKNVKDYNQYSK
ncbi:hypothetical protein [Flammeovirga sp. SJP92]|uniref:hypothetical protein n=1 Tax=Flammeovirga sp. SJP92 TaxID=1775430 RepID=UPI00078924AE|nr:hypothetical protein [Flammeovirga sp. SJP92]KXX68718.1 hypothetical protein AVL50_18775 [Flammeovirga sp. SJP92]